MRLLLCCLVLLPAVLCAHSIADYGGVEGDSSNDAGFTNTKALEATLLAANSSATDRVALIPAGSSYTIFNVYASNLVNVTLQVDGTLFASNNISAWPLPSDVNYTLAVIYLEDSSGITFQGSGEINGQGYDWWWYVILTAIDNRPHLVMMERVSSIEIKELEAKNSPQFHFYLRDVKDVHVHDIRVIVDVVAQRKMLASKGLMNGDIPTFPLNTDGIDPSGANVLIENVYIENFDDAVAVKPANGGHVLAQCSENMMIRNSEVAWGVGMTIGSVPPNENVNCVRNITFENITSHHPIKAIYIKTNPGDSGSGIIDQITYRNFTARDSLWYPIWIGPQQQRQPGTAGTGCSFFYPIIDQCPTQPLVPITNVVLEDVTLTGGVTLPGVLLCNATAPCTGFQFANVKNDGVFLVQDDYVCENVQGSSSGSSPTPSCF